MVELLLLLLLLELLELLELLLELLELLLGLPVRRPADCPRTIRRRSFHESRWCFRRPCCAVPRPMHRRCPDHPRAR